MGKIMIILLKMLKNMKWMVLEKVDKMESLDCQEKMVGGY
jgi:hypothetical protein